MDKEKTSKEIELHSNNINLLTPKIYPKEEAKEKFKNYFQKLNNAINSKDATNIAITGSYGAGKTTIIKNYQNVYDKKETGREYLNISLATFSEEDSKKVDDKETIIDIKLKDENGLKSLEDSNLPKEKKKLERLIELSILQQILYHVEPSTIPNSNLKRIKSIKPKFLIWFTFFSVLWLYATTVLFKFNHISKVNPSNWSFNNSIDWVVLILFLIFTTGVGYIIQKGLRLLNRTKISKLKFLDSELELGAGINKSILNEHIDEIIYFFQKTNFDVIVFEDIDRFNNTEIFTKLREINLLINKSKQIKRALGKIVFVYAVRDDKFKDEERTKFFDYIIPIIPFISPTNASEQLWKLIKQENLEDSFNEIFINDVITFINEIDMRLLINIFNEFLLYKSKLFNQDSNKRRNDNLLAIIIYKNLYPQDFSELSKGKGEMFKIISKKKDYIKSEIKEIEVLMESLILEIKKIENELPENINELRAIYVNNIHLEIPNAIKVFINNTSYYFDKLIDEDVFEELKTLDKIKYQFYQRYNNQLFSLSTSESNVSFKDIEYNVNKEFSFNERVELIENKSNTKITELRGKIEKLKKKITDMQSWDLTQVFQELNKVPDMGKFKNSRLIKYLLFDGYINENYNHFISLFHAENLTQGDFDFEIKVKSRENTAFNYSLMRLDNLIKKIDVRFFERPVTLNFDLLNYLLNNQEKEKIKLDRFFVQLSNENKRVIEFIDAYIENEELNTQNSEKNNVKPFINLLCKNWGRFWDYIYLDSNYTEQKIKKYITYIIKYADIEDLVFFTNGSNINTYIIQQPDFLTFFEKEYHDKVKKVISDLNIKFEVLGHITDESKNLHRFVYENNYYKINIDNISVILETYHKDNDVSGTDGTFPLEFQSNNYQVILESECKSLIKYINNKINEYVKNTYLKTDMDNVESEEILTKYFLNNKSLIIDLKGKIIENTKTVFSDLSKVDNIESKKKLVKSNKIKPSWDNICSYLSDYEDTFIDETLVSFYNKEENYNTLSQEVLETNNSSLSEFYKSLRYGIIECKDLSIESYSTLILAINKTYLNLDLQKLQTDKIEVLLRNNKLSLTDDNYNKLREHFPNKHISLLENWQYTFIEDIEPYILDEEDLTILLESEKFKLINKIQLIKHITIENLTNSLELSRAVSNIVIESKNLSLNVDMINCILSHKIAIELKVQLLTLYGKNLSKDVMINFITLLPYSYKRISSKTQTTIPKTNVNDNFIKLLQHKNIVGKVKENKWEEYRLWMKKK